MFSLSQPVWVAVLDIPVCGDGEVRPQPFATIAGPRLRAVRQVSLRADRRAAGLCPLTVDGGDGISFELRRSTVGVGVVVGSGVGVGLLGWPFEPFASMGR